MIDPCVGKNCGPGVCTRKSNATYEPVCSCPINRKGDSCEISKGMFKENIFFLKMLGFSDLCRESPRCGGGYCKPNYGTPRGYTCVCEGGVVKTDPCPFSNSIFILRDRFYFIPPSIYSLSNQRLWLTRCLCRN